MSPAAEHSFSQHKRQQYLLMALAFSLPLPLLFSNVIIWLLGLNWLLEGHLIQKIKAVYKKPANVFLALLFLWHVISAMLSTNTGEGWRIAERRLPLLLIPLFFMGKEKLSSQAFASILKAFIAGLVLCMLICLGTAFYHFIQAKDSAHFFYHMLASPVKMNAVYLSAYMVLGVLCITELYRKEWLKQRSIVFPLLLFFILCTILLSSKLMVALLLAALFMFAFGRQIHKQGRIILATLVVITAAVTLLNPQLRQRVKIEFNTDFSVLQQDSFRYDTRFTGTTLRLMLWKHCYDITRENNTWLTGTNTGDFQDKLNERYKASGMYTGNPELHDRGYLGYNPHNEYIELLFALGIPGLLLFLAALFFQFRESLKQKHALYTWFLVVFVLFCFTESVLSTNKGVLFYTFFYGLFGYGGNLNTKDTGDENI